MGVKSVPNTQKSQYLELYVLGSEKSRLVKETLSLDARRETIHLQLESINARILKLHRQIERQQQAEARVGSQTRKDAFGVPVKAPSQPIKTVDINY